jgi:diguanylate cyclase (GGDEF)-like protein
MQLGFDSFADVNAAYGFASGDLLLREAASRIQKILPADVSLFRVRGAEVTVLVGEYASLEQIVLIADNMLGVMARPYEIAGGVTRVTASIGVALAPDDGVNAASLLSNAQSAMTAAREAGGNYMEFFQRRRNEDSQAKKRIGDGLHEALRSDQFCLLFQPIVNLATGKMVKAEALLRWHHPELGLIGPANFIGHAEKSGVIAEIGDWVILQSALAAKALRGRWSDFQVHVNFSATQISSRSFSLQRLLEVTQGVGIPPAALVLEFTESVLIEEESRVHHFLVEAAAAGFQLAIDDFGSGYSSLAYLQRFDFDFVKIDKSFVRVARETARERDLCAAIVSIGRAMNVAVVAEGIETTDQCHRLAGMGCDWGQGYLFGRPLALSALLEQR